MIVNGTKYLPCSPYLPSAILSQFLWFNSNIKIDNKSIFISGFASKNINFVGQIFHENGRSKSWDYIKSEYNLESKLKYVEVVNQRCSVIKVFLEISQNSQENTCARVSFLIK